MERVGAGRPGGWSSDHDHRPSLIMDISFRNVPSIHVCFKIALCFLFLIFTHVFVRFRPQTSSNPLTPLL